MNQLSIMIALLVALALGNATRSGGNPSQQSQLSGTYSEKASLQGQAGTGNPRKERLGGGGEGGFPGF